MQAHTAWCLDHRYSSGVAGAFPGTRDPRESGWALAVPPLPNVQLRSCVCPEATTSCWWGTLSPTLADCSHFPPLCLSGVSLKKVLPLLHLVEARRSGGAGFLRNPDRFFPSPHPFSSEPLLGFLLFHTVWWEFLQLHTFPLFEALPAVFIAAQEATQWLKTTNMCLFVHVSVGQLDSVWPGSAGLAVSAVSWQVPGWFRMASLNIWWLAGCQLG